ncbi:MAG: type IV pilin protein [Methylococcaceae bacterium]|jgi:type IV pilus assembly protein PilE
MKQTQQGFTLIELMIAVAIVGIISAIAYPGYQDSVRKSHRAQAEADLVSLANAMERHFTESNSYCDAGGAGGANNCGVAGTNDTGSPTIFSATSPSSGGTAVYNLTITAVTANSFSVQAAPTGAQTKDKCGTLTLTSVGVRGQAAGASSSECWKS